MPADLDRRDRPETRVRVVEVDIPSDVRLIERVVELVRRECEFMGFAQRQISLNVPVALTEAVSNAILRGNGDDPAKHVRVRAEVDTSASSSKSRDEGAGFDLDASLVDPTMPDNLEREDGRGLFLMRKLMDTVERIDAPARQRGANDAASRMSDLGAGPRRVPRRDAVRRRRVAAAEDRRRRRPCSTRRPTHAPLLVDVPDGRRRPRSRRRRRAATCSSPPSPGPRRAWLALGPVSRRRASICTAT